MLYDRKRFQDEYRKILDPLDNKWDYERCEPGYWIKHQVAHYVDPEKIVEIGIRSGYSAWAMTRGAPGAMYTGYDNYAPTYGGDYKSPKYETLSEQFERWARHLIKPPHQIIVQDTTRDGFIPESADLYHIDGDHRYEQALNDIRNCLRVGFPGSVVIVHDYMAKPVREACERAAKEFNRGLVEIVEKRNGDGLIFSGKVPDWLSKLETE